MKIILLNGPPSSGKDTAAKIIRAMHGGYRIERFSMPIKRAFAGMMNVFCDNAGNVHHFETVKETKIELFGASYRQWQIDFSEKFLKPLYGEEIFGKLLVERIRSRPTNIGYNYVIPDCGFQVEIDVLYRTFDPKDLLLIRLHREGFDFSKDSRGYVQLRGDNRAVDVYNQGPVENFESTILDTVALWTNQQ